MAVVRTSIEFGCDEGGKVDRRSRDLARRFTLANGAEWAERKRAATFHFDDVEVYWPVRETERVSGDVALLRPIRTVAAGRRALEEVYERCAASGLRLDSFLPANPTKAWRIHPEKIAIAASRPGVRHSEAIVSAQRSLVGLDGFGDGGQPIISYSFTADAVCVIPEARGHGLSAALGAGVLSQIELDFGRLADILEDAPEVSLCVNFYAEIISEGGEVWVDKITGSLRDLADIVLGPQVRVTVDAGW